jgi:hypothetical protein
VKRSKMLWILSILFAWGTVMRLSALFRADSVTDYGLMKLVGLGALFYIMNMPLIIGQGLTTFLLFTKRVEAHFVGYVVIIAGCIYSLLVYALTSSNIRAARSLYAASRNARGMTEIPQSALDLMISPGGVIFGILFTLAWTQLMVACINKVRPELNQG